MLELNESEVIQVSGGYQIVIAMNYGEGLNEIVVTAERPSPSESFFWGQMDNIKNEICNIPFEAAGLAIASAGPAKAVGAVTAAAGTSFGPAGTIIGYALGYRATQVAGAYIGRQVGGGVCSQWP